MTYSNELIAAQLKKARENKGLSQRELSRTSGVPQSHISKIENNGVDLRLSSLVSLAHALDLELNLIPRRVAPAVRSIARGALTQDNRGSVNAMRELARALKAIETLPAAFRGSSAACTLQEQLSDLYKSQIQFQESDPVRQIRTAIEAIDGSDGMKRLQKAVKDTRMLWNRLPHETSTIQGELQRSQPAYLLAEDDNDV